MSLAAREGYQGWVCTGSTDEGAGCRVLVSKNGGWGRALGGGWWGGSMRGLPGWGGAGWGSMGMGGSGGDGA